jgi:hypothetical protein
MITESDELSAGIDKAALLWPECNSRTELIRKLIDEGTKAIVLRIEAQATEREKAVLRLIEAGTGMWPADFDEQRKSEWPD